MKRIDTCRLCGSGQLHEVIDLGLQSLSDFRDDDAPVPRVPLQVLLCGQCGLLQLRHTADPGDLYHERYSFKSGVNPAIRDDLRDVVNYAIGQRGNTGRWLDIASNDGTLLSYVPTFFHRTGIDPLPQFADDARRYADRVIVDLFDPAYFEPGEFDVITSVSMFYDLDDPHEFVAGVESVLAEDGIWVIQQNYLPAMLANNSVDNISHEHLAYYSLATMERLLGEHGLEVNDVQISPINGGCFRTLVTRTGSRPIRASVKSLAAQEEAAGLAQVAAYEQFAADARANLEELAALVRDINGRGERVWVYGASTRGGTVWQAAGLTAKDLPFVVDRNPDKVGKVMSAIGAPIISEEQARAERPEYLLVGPWWFKDVFIDRERDYLAGGGRLIFPLPHLEIVGA